MAAVLLRSSRLLQGNLITHIVRPRCHVTSGLSLRWLRTACTNHERIGGLNQASKSGNLRVHRGQSQQAGSITPLHLFSSLPDGKTDPQKKSTVKEPLQTRLLTSLTPHENIYTIPNILTISRLVAAPIIGYLVLHDQHAWAVGLLAYAGITDLIDGYIARRWKLQTVVGTVIDPMADKTLMTILTVCLAVKGALPVWLATIILGRDILLGIAAIYYRYISLPPPKTFSRYWDFSLPSAEVHPTGISKANTALQLALIGGTVGLPLVTGVDLRGIMVGMQYLVATTTIWSGASYIYTKDAVKILSQEEKVRK